MENRVEMAAYAAFGVAGLCITASLLSLGLTHEVSSVATTITLGTFGVSLVGLGLSCVWHGPQPARTVARPLSNPERPATPRAGA
jgi:hypothetical protein